MNAERSLEIHVALEHWGKKIEQLNDKLIEALGGGVEDYADDDTLEETPVAGRLTLGDLRLISAAVRVYTYVCTVRNGVPSEDSTEARA